LTELPLSPDDARAAGIRTLVELLGYRAGRQPADVVFRVINSDGAEDGSRSFAMRQLRARRQG